YTIYTKADDTSVYNRYPKRLDCRVRRLAVLRYMVSVVASSRLSNQSTAATMPTISSLSTFSPRPIVFELGELFFLAAAIRSFLPSNKPVHCGPRRPLPPENVTRSNPICV